MIGHTTPKRYIQRIKQGRISERLKQTFHRSLVDGVSPHSLILVSGNEDDWRLYLTTL